MSTQTRCYGNLFCKDLTQGALGIWDSGFVRSLCLDEWRRVEFSFHNFHSILFDVCVMRSRAAATNLAEPWISRIKTKWVGCARKEGRKEGRRNLHLTTNSPSFHAMFLSLCIGGGMHSQGTLCFALLMLMSVSLCVYILHLSLMSFAQSNTLLVQSLHWELRLCGSSSSSDSFCVCVFFLTSSQWTLSLPELWACGVNFGVFFPPPWRLGICLFVWYL
jgi:hypothetical protein